MDVCRKFGGLIFQPTSNGTLKPTPPGGSCTKNTVFGIPRGKPKLPRVPRRTKKKEAESILKEKWPTIRNRIHVWHKFAYIVFIFNGKFKCRYIPVPWILWVRNRFSDSLNFRILRRMIRMIFFVWALQESCEDLLETVFQLIEFFWAPGLFFGLFFFGGSEHL